MLIKTLHCRRQNHNLTDCNIRNFMLKTASYIYCKHNHFTCAKRIKPSPSLRSQGNYIRTEKLIPSASISRGTNYSEIKFPFFQIFILIFENCLTNKSET